MFFHATLVYKPGSVLTAIYLALQLLAGSSRLLEAVGSTCMLLHGVAPDRVYIVKPMSPWAGWALTPPFHPYLSAVYLCCTCPKVTLGGRYPLSLPCGARTFLIRCLSACVRGCPTWSREYCTANKPKCQMSCKFFSYTIYYKLNNCHCEPVCTLAWQSPSTLQKSGGDCHVASLLAMTLNLKK